MESLPSEAALGQEIASASGQLVVVEVWAVWVQTCARFAPTFEAFRADPAFKDRVKFCRVQDTVPGVLDKYKVLAFPSFLFFINGREVARVRAAAACGPPASTATAGSCPPLTNVQSPFSLPSPCRWRAPMSKCCGR